jgi:hypothetical protein
VPVQYLITNNRWLSINVARKAKGYSNAVANIIALQASNDGAQAVRLIMGLIIIAIAILPFVVHYLKKGKSTINTKLS